MSTFDEELERRVEQFRRYLELMRQRRVELTKGDSFIIFEEDLPTDSPEPTDLAEPRALVYESTLEVPGWEDGPGMSTFDETIVTDLPDEGWRGDDSQSRFIQFSFNPKHFDMDIPNVTLYRAEAEQILRCRSGFFYVKDRPEFEHPSEQADFFDPLRKVYVYGDERLAAEDMAYIWFRVWKFPVDWRFYVKASSFHDGVDWEDGMPIE